MRGRLSHMNRLKIVIAATPLLACNCAYLDHARHMVGDFAASAQIHRVGGETLSLRMDIRTLVCASDPYVDTSLWMTDLDAEALESGDLTSGQILHIELLFPPQPGETPIDPDATNLSIRYIVISNGEVGLYEGGGFGYPLGSVEDGSMSLRIEPSGMVLTESTEGFVDLLSPASISAVFSGNCDDVLGGRMADSVDQFMTNTFGRTLYVHGSLPQHNNGGS